MAMLPSIQFAGDFDRVEGLEGEVGNLKTKINTEVMYMDDVLTEHRSKQVAEILKDIRSQLRSPADRLNENSKYPCRPNS